MGGEGNGWEGNFQQRKLRKVQSVFEAQSVVTREEDIVRNKAGKIGWDQIMRDLPGQ